MPLAILGFEVERLRLRDALSLPGLLSLVRAPLAAAFPLALGRPFAGLGILALAGLSDVLDGWCARRSGRPTLTGAVLDPVMDKLFVATVAVTLLVAGDLSLRATLLLSARDILELPLVVWLAFARRAMADRTAQVKANAFGKVATVLQFVTVAAALFAWRHVGPVALASGASGALAAGTYWARAIRRARAAPPGRAGRETPDLSADRARPTRKLS